MVTELYTASSLLEEYVHVGKRFRNLEIFWYCRGRQHPIVRHAQAIERFTTLDEPYRLLASQFLDELFTRGEILVLHEYLQEANMSLSVGTIPLPMDVLPEPDLFIASPVTSLLADPSIVLCPLPVVGRDPLPFKVGGYFLSQARFA